MSPLPNSLHAPHLPTLFRYEHNAAPPLELFNRMLGGRFANSVFITLEEQLLKVCVHPWSSCMVMCISRVHKSCMLSRG